MASFEMSTSSYSSLKLVDAPLLDCALHFSHVYLILRLREPKEVFEVISHSSTTLLYALSMLSRAFQSANPRSLSLNAAQEMRHCQRLE